MNDYSNPEDILGNTYGFAFAGSTERTISNTYAIDGKYDVLSGTVGVLKSSKGHNGRGWLRIYGDGTLLKEEGFTTDTKSYPIEVKITGVTDLKIEIESANETDKYGANCYVMVADPVVKKIIK